MATLLRFPCPADARVAAELRALCRDMAPEAEARVLGRFVRLVNEGRSNGVATFEARRLLHTTAEHCPRGAA